MVTESNHTPASTAPPAAAPATPSRRRSDLRVGVRTLGRGLVVYGLIGCVLTIVGLATAFVLAGRLATVGERVSPQLAAVSETVDGTITALENASVTSETFAGTLQATTPALDEVASSIASVQPQLASIGANLSSFSILGSQPLGQAGALFTQVAGTLSGLGGRLEAVSSGLDANGTSLLSTSASLEALAQSLAKAKVELTSGEIEQSISDLIRVFLIAEIGIVIFFAVPAIGALLLGVWLLRTIPARGGEAGAVPRAG